MSTSAYALVPSDRVAQTPLPSPKSSNDSTRDLMRTVPSGKPCLTKICWMTGRSTTRVAQAPGGTVMTILCPFGAATFSLSPGEVPAGAVTAKYCLSLIHS